MFNGGGLLIYILILIEGFNVEGIYLRIRYNRSAKLCFKRRNVFILDFFNDYRARTAKANIV